MDLAPLESIGLTKGEIKVYGALLELGESTKTPIANESKVSHGKVYDILERLLTKGLVSVIKKEGIKNFKASNPKKLKEYIQRKKENILTQEKTVENLLPILTSKYTSKRKDTDAEIYFGWNGLKTAYDQMLDSIDKQDTNYAFGASKGPDPERTEKFFRYVNNKRYEKKIPLKIIYNHEDKKFAKNILTNNKLDKIRFLKLETPAEINISNNQVIIAIFNETPITILITSKEAADSFKQYFNNMWKLAKK